MKIREIFTIGGIASVLDGRMDYLNGENCQIVNKSVHDDYVVLKLKREVDNIEGNSFLRVKDQYDQIKKELLRKAFINIEVMGLTLDQLRDFDINIEIESSGGRMQIK